MEEAYEKKLAELRDRVLYAESLNNERENDVIHLRNQLHFLTSARKHANRLLIFLSEYTSKNGMYVCDRYVYFLVVVNPE